MRIAIITEGSYPYVTGGVSSWIHTLVTSLPETEFVIYAIGADSSQRGKYKYQFPPNIVQVCEHFLDGALLEKGTWGQRYRMTPPVREALLSLIGGTNEVDWDVLFEWFAGLKSEAAAVSFLRSRSYFDLLEQLSRERYQHVPFTEWFWTVRSMILPLLLLLKEPVPQADLYHCVTTGYAGVIGSLAKWTTGKPLLLTEHGIYTREREEEIIKSDWVPSYFKELWIDYFYTLSSCIYQMSDQVITLFKRNQEIEEELGCEPRKISIIPNGVDVEAFQGLPQREEDDGCVYIGAVVRVVPIKDIKTMIQSFALVKQEVPEARFIIMGPTEEDEEYYEECESLVETLQVQDITFTGGIQIRDMIGKMDILVLTSISEGQPLAVLEGMAAGKPFVTTDVGSCKELLYGIGDDDTFGQAGWVAPVMNVDQLAYRMIDLCRDPQMRLRMGEAGRERVKERYNRYQFIEAYRNIYASYKGS